MRRATCCSGTRRARSLFTGSSPLPTGKLAPSRRRGSALTSCERLPQMQARICCQRLRNDIRSGLAGLKSGHRKTSPHSCQRLSPSSWAKMTRVRILPAFASPPVSIRPCGRCVCPDSCARRVPTRSQPQTPADRRSRAAPRGQQIGARPLLLRNRSQQRARARERGALWLESANGPRSRPQWGQDAARLSCCGTAFPGKRRGFARRQRGRNSRDSDSRRRPAFANLSCRRATPAHLRARQGHGTRHTGPGTRASAAPARLSPLQRRLDDQLAKFVTHFPKNHTRPASKFRGVLNGASRTDR